MPTSYETDVVAWANEQAALLRSGQLAALDIEHIAEEIEDVGKSERLELASRTAVLLAHLLKWEFQPDLRGKSWKLTITEQRARINRKLGKVPSLKPALQDGEWIADVWVDAKTLASKETGIGYAQFPLECPWSITDVLTEAWLPT